MEKSSLSENVRASRIKELLKDKGLKRKDLAEMIEVRSRDGGITTMDPQNLSRCLTSGKVSDKLCRKIIEVFPEYNLEWLLGISNEKKKEDVKKEYVRNIDTMNNALVAVLEGALREVCARENLDFSEELSKFGTNEPLWIWESVLLQDQLRDFAIGLVWNYVKHRDNASFWSSLDTIIENISRK